LSNFEDEYSDAPVVLETPQAPEAEALYLGALLSGAKPLPIVSSDDLYQDRHRFIHDAIATLWHSREPVDVVTVNEELRKHGYDQAIGTIKYLKELVQPFEHSKPDESNLEAHAVLIREKSNVRRGLVGLEKAREKFLNGVGVEGGIEFLQNFVGDLKLRQTAKKREYSTVADLEGILDQISWLWHGWIPVGFTTVLCGPWEVGKSNIALDWCQRVLNGEDWPDGAPNPIADQIADGYQPRILWIDTEASAAMLRQRIQDRGIDPSRFILPPDPLREIQLDNESDWKFIEGALEDFRPRLVIIDSLSGGHEGDSNSNDFMKKIMKRVGYTAQKYQTAIVVIHGLKKGMEGINRWPLTMDMMMGASAVAQYARSVVGVGVPSFANPNARAMMSVKNNLAPKPRPLGYSITDQGAAWGEAPEPPQAHSAHADAKAFLLEVLSSVPRPTKDVEAECLERGICSIRTLNDARKALGVKTNSDVGPDGKKRYYIWLERNGNAMEGGGDLET
jgi:hypothetical protein